MADGPLDETLASGDTPAEDGSGEAAALPATDGTRYQIVGEVGRGGLGLILRAVDRRLDRQIALKLMTSASSSSRARFDAEARITARLEHPSIVPVYDAGHLGGAVPFYAMKLSGGRTLASAIRDAPDLGARLSLLGAVLAIADAIAYAHSRGIVHRDLKPDNVLVGEFGETLVIDWGLAKELGANEPSVEPNEDGEAAHDPRTRAGDVLGTPAFMAPEQARGEPADLRADVFAIGAILYTVLSGEPPRRGSSSKVLDEARTKPITPIQARVDGVPRDLAAICARALSVDRDERYPSARELAEDLRRFQNGQLVAARDYTVAQRIGRWIRKHRSLVAMASASLVALLVVGSVLLVRVFEARRASEQQTARLMLAQARSAMDRDPAAALGWLRRLLESPAIDSVDLEDVRVAVADARSRGVPRFALDGAADIVALDGTPDGRVVVGRTIDGRIAIWDVEHGKLRARLTETFRSAAISRDGSTLATAGERDVTLRDLDGRVRERVTSAQPLAAVGLTGDDRLLLVGEDGVIRIPSGPQLSLDHKVTLVRGLPDGRVAFAGEGIIGWWDPRTNHIARAELAVAPVVLTASSDGALLGIWAGDRTLVYALDGDRVSVVDTGDMGSVVFGANTLIAWGVRTGIRVRQRTTNHELLLPAPQNAYLTFAGRRLAASNDSTKLYVFDELPVEPVRAWKRSKAVRFVKSSGAGRVAYLTTDGEVGIADGRTGEITPIVTDPRFYVGDQVALGIIDDRIVVGGDALRAIDPRTRTVTDVWTRSPACIAQLPSGQAVVIAATGELRLYDRELAKVELEARIASAARDCVARPDGSVAVSHDGGVVSVIDTHGREVASDRGDGDTTDALAAMPDGSIIIGDFRGHVRRWVPGTASRTLFQHLGPVWGVAVSPDGRWIATCGRDRTARISTPDGEVVEIHRGHEDEVASVAFSSTGDVVSAGMDGRILRWPIDPARAPPSSVDELVHQIDTLTSIAADQ